MASGKGLTNNVITTGIYHAKVHQGLMFSSEHFSEALVDDGTIEVLLLTSANGNHVLYNATAGGDAKLQFYEAPTATGEGTPLDATNHNRETSYVTTATAFHTPTLSADGTLLDTLLMPGGSGGSSQGGSGDILLDWELLPTTYYLFRLTNIAGQAKLAHLHVNFYENLAGSIF